MGCKSCPLLAAPLAEPAALNPSFLVVFRGTGDLGAISEEALSALKKQVPPKVASQELLGNFNSTEGWEHGELNLVSHVPADSPNFRPADYSGVWLSFFLTHIISAEHE